MKIRTDYVTNSSSVSYIILMDLDIVDCFLGMEEKYAENKEPAIISRRLREFLINQGTSTYIEGHEIYTFLIKFRDDDDEALTKENLRDGDLNTDVSTMTDTELFNYLRGEYLLKRNMDRLVSGFSAIQVEQY